MVEELQGEFVWFSSLLRGEHSVAHSTIGLKIFWCTKMTFPAYIHWEQLLYIQHYVMLYMWQPQSTVKKQQSKVSHQMSSSSWTRSVHLSWAEPSVFVIASSTIYRMWHAHFGSCFRSRKTCCFGFQMWTNFFRFWTNFGPNTQDKIRCTNENRTGSMSGEKVFNETIKEWTVRQQHCWVRWWGLIQFAVLHCWLRTGWQHKPIMLVLTREGLEIFRAN